MGLFGYEYSSLVVDKFVTLPLSVFARERLALAEDSLQTMQLS